jgi:hypothetical protein
MAYKRNLSFPLAPTFEEDKPKKKRTTSYGEGSKTVKKRSGATKKTTISDMGRTKTVTKTSKKGVTTSRTKTISPDYKSATYTKKKDGKVVKNVTSYPSSPENIRRDQFLEASYGGDYYGTAKRQRRKAVEFTQKPSKIKAKQEDKENRRNTVSPNKARRQAEREAEKNKRKRKHHKKKKARETGGKYGETSQTGRKNKKVKSCPSGGKVYDKRSCKAKNTKNIN